jgi:hypothetical protein
LNSFCRVLLVAVVALFCAGCQKQSSLTPVRGKVFIGDEPAGKGQGYVTFHPDEKKGNKSLEEGVGRIQSDGTYLVETRGETGIAPGWYKVGVSVAEVLDPANPYVTKHLIPEPEKYQDWNRSGISIEVVAGEAAAGKYDIKLPPLEN